MIGNETLLARLGLDTAGFKAALKESHGIFRQWAGGLAGMLSTVGLSAYTKQIVEYGSTIQDLAERFNVSTTALQRFGNAGEETGTSLEGVARGFNKLEISQSRSLAGNEAQIKAFANLGITIEDLRTLSPEDLMLKLGQGSMNAADMVAVLGKNALELRPLLAGLADGTIKLGEAIDASFIRELDKADDALKKLYQNLRIFAGSGVAAFSLNFKGMGMDIKAFFDVIKEGLSDKNFFSVSAQLKGLRELREIAAGRGPSKKMWEEYEAGRAKDMVKNLHTPMELMNPSDAVSAPAGKKSRAQLAAELKALERDQLSLKELTGEGAQFSRRNADGTTTQATGTLGMIFAASQARLVEQLEAQAKQVRLTGISATGETSGELLSRADAIRQTLPIKETEKEVGIYSAAFKQSLSGVEEKLDAIEAQLE